VTENQEANERSNYPIHKCAEYHDEGTRLVETPCACRYPSDHPWPPHGGENGRRLLHQECVHAIWRISRSEGYVRCAACGYERLSGAAQ
jgi:hypothetical protein